MYLNELLEIWLKENYPDHFLGIHPYADGSNTYVGMDLSNGGTVFRCDVYLDRVEILLHGSISRPETVYRAADPLFLEKMKEHIDCRLSIFGDAIGS